MTLVEVVLSIFLAAMVIGGTMASIFMATQCTKIAAQHTAAMQLCMQMIETLRTAEFDDLVAENYPPENGIPLVAAKTSGNPVLCTRSVAISNADSAGIEARRVQILVAWNYRGMNRSVPYETIIYKFH